MTEGDLQSRAMEVYNAIQGREDNPLQCVDMLKNALRNCARDLADEEHVKRMQAEAQVATLKDQLDEARAGQPRRGGRKAGPRQRVAEPDVLPIDEQAG